MKIMDCCRKCDDNPSVFILMHNSNWIVSLCLECYRAYWESLGDKEITEEEYIIAKILGD